MKKCVILVNSLYNVILATQLRKTLFPDDDFDIVLSDQAPGLDEVYARGELLKTFDNVYYGKVDRLTRSDRFIGVLNPGQNFRRMLDIDKLPEYTDIFLWNPDRVFYSYYMECKRKKRNLDIHVYGEANAGWFKDSPDIDANYEQYAYKVLNDYVRKHYDYKKVAEMDYDFYMFLPEWSVCEHPHKTVQIPPIDTNDKEFIAYINSIFGYDTSFKIDEPVIFLGTVPKEDDSEEHIKDMLQKLADCVGKENFIIKRHPRDGATFYKDMGLKYIQQVFAWDLYCLNNDIDSKIFISYGSSSVMIPCAAYGCKPTVCIYKSRRWSDEIYIGQLERFVEKMRTADVEARVFTDSDIMVEYIRDLREW